ncbi:MAG: porin [Burkholderiales bacterium]|nr:porin [Burkholderiales bacterium]MBI3728920.1 porin [Burkholderiales bacterium]
MQIPFDFVWSLRFFLFTVFATISASLQAQTSEVKIYGYLDLGIVKETGTTARLDRGLNNWLGVKGSEDLGDGSIATFHLQMRFNPDTGAQERSSTLFQGETTVGLKSAAGHLRLGRALTPLWQEKWLYDPWYDSGFMGSLETYNGDFNSDGLLSADFHNYSRASNSVFYGSPANAGLLGNFRFSTMVEIERPEGAADRSRSFSVNYASGPVTAMLAYEKNHIADSIIYVAGSYLFDKFTLIASYSRTTFAISDLKLSSRLIAGTYSLNGNTIRLGYGRLHESGNNKYSLGYNHAMSKRTNIYFDIYRERTIKSTNGQAIGINHAF